jgi:hypothetical protein
VFVLILEIERVHNFKYSRRSFIRRSKRWKHPFTWPQQCCNFFFFWSLCYFRVRISKIRKIAYPEFIRPLDIPDKRSSIFYWLYTATLFMKFDVGNLNIPVDKPETQGGQVNVSWWRFLKCFCVAPGSRQLHTPQLPHSAAAQKNAVVILAFASKRNMKR